VRRRLVPLFPHDPSRSAVASKVTIYLPTRRAVRVLRSEFVDLLGGRSAILPSSGRSAKPMTTAAISTRRCRRRSISRSRFQHRPPAGAWRG
jgi:hypothetical protein